MGRIFLRKSISTSPFLNDIQIIEELPEDSKSEIISVATNVAKLNKARDEFLQTKQKLSDAQFAQMQELENEIPNKINRLKENEADLEKVNKELDEMRSKKQELDGLFGLMNTKFKQSRSARTFGAEQGEIANYKNLPEQLTISDDFKPTDTDKTKKTNDGTLKYKIEESLLDDDLDTKRDININMAIIDKFKISIINGINDPIKRLARVAMRETSKLALLKRTSSVFTLLKTRITRIPVKFSLITKFNLSIFFCII